MEDSWIEAALRRDAYRFLEEFFELDQPTVISLTDEAFNRSKELTTCFADFAIIWSPPGAKPPRITHSEVIQNRRDPAVTSTFDTVVFKRIEEVNNSNEPPRQSETRERSNNALPWSGVIRSRPSPSVLINSPRSSIVSAPRGTR